MPTRRRLTEKFLRSLKPKSKAYEVTDEVVRGMSIRVWPSGRMTWSLRYYPGGKERRMSLGEYPILGLADARDRTLAIKRQVSAGEDPRRKNMRITLLEAVERWAAAHYTTLADLRVLLRFGQIRCQMSAALSGWCKIHFLS